MRDIESTSFFCIGFPMGLELLGCASMTDLLRNSATLSNADSSQPCAREGETSAAARNTYIRRNHRHADIGERGMKEGG